MRGDGGRLGWVGIDSIIPLEELVLGVKERRGGVVEVRRNMMSVKERAAGKKKMLKKKRRKLLGQGDEVEGQGL